MADKPVDKRERIFAVGERINGMVELDADESPAMAGDSDRNFYVAIAAYGAAFGTGLFLLGDNAWFSGGWIYGAILTAGGGLGLVSVTPLFRPKLEALRSTRSLWAIITMTWLLLAVNVGFAIYDHLENPSQKTTQSNSPDSQGVLPTPDASNTIDVTPEYLMLLYKDGTSAEGDARLQQYVGFWIRVTKVVGDVKGNTVWTYTKDPDGGSRLILLAFDAEWIKRILILKTGQSISALCQITPAAAINQIVLSHCRLETNSQ